MKIPESGIEKINQSEDQNQASIRECNARVSRANQDAAVLRTRLEAMEDLLAQTKTKLVAANAELEEKDRRLINVHTEAKALNQSVQMLEDRFKNLKTLQEELHIKREKLIVDEHNAGLTPDAPEKQEATSAPTAQEATNATSAPDDKDVASAPIDANVPIAPIAPTAPEATATSEGSAEKKDGADEQPKA